jgi:hypothetical protein
MEPKELGIFGIETDWLDLLKKRKIKGSLADVMYEIGTKNAKFEAGYNNALIKAMIGYDGNSSLNVTAPMFGGNVGFDANRNNGNNSYYLQFQKRF